MRGKADRQGKMFFAIDLEERVRPDHPLRPIKSTVENPPQLPRRLSGRLAGRRPSSVGPRSSPQKCANCSWLHPRSARSSRTRLPKRYLASPRCPSMPRDSQC